MATDMVFSCRWKYAPAYVCMKAIRTCLKINVSAVKTRQKWARRRESGVYTPVNGHFDPIFNAVSASAAILR